MSGEHESAELPDATTRASAPVSTSADTWGSRPESAGAPASEVDLRDRIALVVGVAVGFTISALDISVWWAVGNASVGGWMASAILWGVPLAVLVLIVCGAITRRFRLWLVAVGGFLFASPWIGLGISLLLD